MMISFFQAVLLSCGVAGRLAAADEADQASLLQLHAGSSWSWEDEDPDIQKKELQLRSQWSDENDGEFSGLLRTAVVEHDTLETMGKKTIWVPTFPRTGSSTLLSMITGPSIVEKDGGDTESIFALFEPCHIGDRMGERVYPDVCHGLIEGIASCNFSEVSRLWGWKDKRSKLPSATRVQVLRHDLQQKGKKPKDKVFPRAIASAGCASAGITAFKTIHEFHDIERDVIPILEKIPTLYAVVPVRDPRGIYASLVNTKGMRDRRRDPSRMDEFCASFAGTTEAKHPRLMYVRFEDMVTKPTIVMKIVYDFLGLPFGQAQEKWVKKRFDADKKDCPHEYAYGECRTDSKSVPDKWRKQLNQEEVDYFKANANCTALSERLHYELDVEVSGA